MKKTEKEKLLDKYKTDFMLEKSDTGHKRVWNLFKASVRESWEYLVKLFTFYISILGILLLSRTLFQMISANYFSQNPLS